MDLLLLPRPIYGTWKRYWRRKRYQRLDGAITSRRNMKIARFGGSPRRSWKIRVVPKLRLKKIIVSPLKLLTKLKNSYMNMMLKLAGNTGSLNGGINAFGNKRIPKARQVKVDYKSIDEFENRLIFEIYKALIATRDLGPM